MERAQPPLHPWVRPFGNLGKGAALSCYLRRLPRFLLEDYGHGGPYRPKQVEATIYRHRFSRRYVSYAQLLFCDRGELGLGYEAARGDLARRYFSGNLNFSRRHVDAYAPRYTFDDRGEWMFSDGASVGGDGGHGGGHGGGDGGH